jgi:CHAT domain-containing protein
VYARRGNHGDAIDAYKSALQSASEKFSPLVKLSIINTYIAMGSTQAAEEVIKEVGEPRNTATRHMLRRTLGHLRLSQAKYREALQIFHGGLKEARGADSTYQKLWLQDGIARAYSGLGNRKEALSSYLEAIELADGVRAKFRSEEFKTGLFGDTQRIFEDAIALATSMGDYDTALTISEKSRARALLDMIRERTTASPAGGAAGLPIAAVDLAVVRKGLGPNQAIVQYHVLETQTVMWVIRSDQVTGAVTALSRAKLTGMVEDFRSSVTKLQRTARSKSREIHDALIKPLPLRDGEPLVIVPHGPLHYLPFQALYNGESYLIELHPLTIAPSASVAYQTATAYRQHGSKLVAFGNPDLGKEELALPGAQREVEMISGLFTDKQVFFQSQATKTQFKEVAGRSSVLHVAAHAEVDEVDPLFSRVLLTPDENDDGWLEAREIFDLNLTPVSLVTLSACESGLGKVAKGDEILGFTRSFLSAGVSGLIVSLWPVSDESTELLMTTLYSQLREGKTARQAMQAGQLAVLRNRKFSHPFYWAPFNLIGNWRLQLDG